MKIAAFVAYLACIVAANWLVNRFGFVPVWPGVTAAAGTYAAGAALLARDALQDAAGRRAVLLAIAGGAALSWWLSTPQLAVASGVAFLIAETADMAVYTPLRKRRPAPRRARWAASRRRNTGSLSEVGMPGWIAPQDWMCERAVIEGGRFDGKDFAGTGLSVIEHQRRTVENGITLRQLAKELPFIYVLQGQKPDDYVRCFELYKAAGVDLTKERLVGVGSVCRIQNTQMVVDIFAAIAQLGIPRLHGFGVKIDGVKRILTAFAEMGCLEMLHSTDTQVWSWLGRRFQARVPGCYAGHKNCANCLTWMIRHTQKLRADIDRLVQQFQVAPGFEGAA